MDERIAEILKDLYGRAMAILREHAGLLESVSRRLLEMESLSESEFRELLRSEVAH